MATKSIKTEKPIELPAMNIQHAEIVLIGDSSLISHKWSEKSKKEIRDKQQKKAKTAKDIRNVSSNAQSKQFYSPCYFHLSHHIWYHTGGSCKCR